MVQSHKAKCFLKPSLLLFGLNDWLLFPFLFTSIYWRHPIFNCGIIIHADEYAAELQSTSLDLTYESQQVSRDTEICRPEGKWRSVFARFKRCIFFEIWRVRFSIGNETQYQYVHIFWLFINKTFGMNKLIPTFLHSCWTGEPANCWCCHCWSSDSFLFQLCCYTSLPSLPQICRICPLRHCGIRGIHSFCKSRRKSPMRPPTSLDGLSRQNNSSILLSNKWSAKSESMAFVTFRCFSFFKWADEMAYH